MEQALQRQGLSKKFVEEDLSDLDEDKTNDNGGDDSVSDGSRHEDNGESPDLCCTCKKQCWREFSPRERHQIYTNFWKLPSDMEKSRWLWKHVREPSRVISEERPKDRCLYKKFQLWSGRTKSMLKVCSPFFRTTLGLSSPELLHFLGEDQSIKFGSNKAQLHRRTSPKLVAQKSTDNNQLHSGDEDDESVTQAASALGNDLKSLDFTFDLGDNMAALCVRQAFTQQPRLLDDIPEKQSAALILHKFNQTYPMHTMNMSHFLSIYRKVSADLKSREISKSCGNKTYFSADASGDETGHLWESESEGSSNNGYNSKLHSKGKRKFKQMVKSHNDLEDVGSCSENSISDEPCSPVKTAKRSSRLIRKESLRESSQKGLSRSQLKVGRLGTGCSKLEASGSKRVNPKRATRKGIKYYDSSKLRGFRDDASHRVEQKFQEAVRNRVNKLKQYAINTQLKVRAKDEEHSSSKIGSRVNLSAFRTPQKRLCSLRVLRFKHKHPLLPPCKCTRRNCLVKIPEERRQAIHEAFWSLVSVQDRKLWLLKFVERLVPAENIRSFFRGKKYLTKQYFLPDSRGERVEVCRLFFIHTLGFKRDSVIEYIILSKPPLTYTAKPIRKRPPRQLPDVVVKSIRKYILSMTSHAKSIKGGKSATVDQNISATSTDLDKDKHFTAKSLRNTSSLGQLKDWFLDYKEKHCNSMFNLGYQSFRRVCENVLLEKRQLGSPAINSSEEEHQSESSDADEDKESSGNGLTKLKEEGEPVPTSQDLSGSKSKTDNWILDVESGIFRTTPQNLNSQKKKPLTDVRSNASKTNFWPVHGETRRQYKSRRPLSKYNDKTFHPVQPPCKCYKKCFEKITSQQRQAINDEFWASPTYNERKQWLNEHIDRKEFKGKKGQPHQASGKNSKKTESRTYLLPDSDGRMFRVCRKFFLGTLGYKWDKVIFTLARTTGRGEEKARPDMRGHMSPQCRIPMDTLMSVAKYCESVCLRHRDLYRQKNLLVSPEKLGKPHHLSMLSKYGLTMNQLLSDYKTKHPNRKVSYLTFRRVFKLVYSDIVLSNSLHFNDWRGLNKEINMHSEPDPAGAHGGEASASTYDSAQDESCDSQPEIRIFEEEDSDSDSYAGLSVQTVGANSNLDPGVQDPALQDKFQNRDEIGSYQDTSKDLKSFPGHVSLHSSQTNNSRPANNTPHSFPSRNIMEANASNNLPVHQSGTFAVAGTSGNTTSLFPSQQNPQCLGPQTKDTSDYSRHGVYPARPGDTDMFAYYQRGPLQCQPFGNPVAESQLSSNASSFQSHHVAHDGRMDLSINRLQDALPSLDTAGQNYYLNNHANYRAHQPYPYFPALPNTHQSDATLSGLADHRNKSTFETYPNFVKPCSPFTDTLLHNQYLKADALGQVQETITMPAHEKSSKGKGKSCKHKKQKTVGPKKPIDCESEAKAEKKGARAKSARNSAANYPMLPPCNCAKKCYEKFSEEARQIIHDLFWALGSYNNRKQWLLLHIKRTAPKRRRVDSFDVSKKNETRFYYLPEGRSTGGVLEVCKQFFLRTLGYRWDKIIMTLSRTTPRGECVSVPDQRGKNTPAHNLRPVVMDSVKSYIKALMQSAKTNGNPLVSDSRGPTGSGSSSKSKVARSPNVLVPYGLTVKDLYDDYKTKHSDHKISLQVFRKIYKTTDWENATDTSETEIKNFDYFLELC